MGLVDLRLVLKQFQEADMCENIFFLFLSLTIIMIASTDWYLSMSSGLLLNADHALFHVTFTVVLEVGDYPDSYFEMLEVQRGSINAYRNLEI